MARKRKIPARKHHGVRDPLKQLEAKEHKLAGVTNNPPTAKDEQRVSYKFKQFKKLADEAKAGKKLKRILVGQEDKGSSEKNNGTARTQTHRNIKQFRGEADEDYLKRVNRITSASVREAQYEAKYGVSVIRNPKTGEITIQKRPKNEIDELLKKKQKEQRLAKNGRRKKTTEVKGTMDAKTSKELIKRAFKEADQEDDSDEELNATSLEYKRDTFKFGEIVHAPPSLTTLPRKAAKNETVPRPGRKSNLLLKSLLDTTQPVQPKPNSHKQTVTKAVAPTKAQMKGKRKELPAATRSMLEVERSKMVELYRTLKKTRELQRQQ
ncbi:coiled-coil domain-containing protein 137 [Scaptodrosophila lebanonensis]|uniref:Coiled-coil domain-containing protein 137 n=1 Tax=Drosophila lebanonensis TaxID=7225 RepID=A0A6J2TVX5_DROLE|nr:coiled-coil domain-containing protein 137 [Scaptodrosophila lebanonensis]